MNLVRLATIGALAAGLLAAVLLFGLPFVGGNPERQYKAVFADAGGLRKNSEVKIGGVKAGTIKNLDVTSGDRALATFELDPEAGKIGPGATARVRPVNLLGEKYLELTPGKLDKPLPPGSTIPVERTSAPVELDDVLNMLDTSTRGRLRILINEAGVGMMGRGTDLNRFLDQLPPTVESTRRFLAEIDSENVRLRRAIEQGDRVIAAMNRRSGDLVDLVYSAQAALRVTADKRTQLGETIEQSPSTLAQLRSTLGKLETTSDALVPAAAELRRTIPPLNATLEELPPFARDVRGTLRQVSATSPFLSRLGRRTTPVIRRARPTVARLATFTRDLAPVVDILERQGGLRGVLTLMTGWSETVRRADGLGHVFGLRAIGDSELVTSAVQRYGSGSPIPTGVAKRGKKGRPAAAARGARPSSGQSPARPAPGQAPEQSAAADDAARLLNYLVGP